MSTTTSTNVRHIQKPHGGVFREPEPERAGTVTVLCSRARRRMDHSASHTPFRLFSNTVTLDPTPIPTWPERSDVACWYCCHQFETVPISIPRSVIKSDHRKYFEVYGVFCSLNCAKKHLLSMHTHDQQQLLMQLNELCVNVYGMHVDDVFNAKEAPPKIFLKMFGGHLDIEEFRKMSASARTVLVTPPFVSHTMMLEVHSATDNPGAPPPIHTSEHAVRNLRRPAQPVSVLTPTPTPTESRFDAFMKSRCDKERVTDPVKTQTTAKRKRKRDPPVAAPAAVVGGLGGFLKSSARP